MISLLKEVGRGKRGSRDLTYEEAQRAAALILDGESTPAQTGAFLLAERIKLESADELLAFAEALRSRSYRHPVAGSFDCAGPYDGRTKSFMATLPAAFILCACGLPVTLHGSEPLPPKNGVTLLQVMKLLQINLTRQSLLAGAARSGLLFVPTEDWCPPLKELRPIREQLGLRTLFNTAEKLIGFSHPTSIAFGVFHGTIFEKMASLLQHLGYRSGIIVQGMEGSEDLPVDKRSRTLILREGTTELYVVDPELLGLAAEPPEIEWTADRQLETMLAVLRGEAGPIWTNMTVLNSAVRLWVAGSVNSMEEGIHRSHAVLQQGTAQQSFLKWLEAVR